MLFTLWFLLPIYILLALVFAVLSVTELQETGNGSAARLLFALAGAVFWPLSLLVVSLYVASASSGRSKKVPTKSKAPEKLVTELARE